MRVSLFSLLIGVVAADTLFSRATTPDNTCGVANAGNGKGYTCNPSLANGGPCCSANGWCGSGTSYCGTGCQSQYGSCGTVSSSTSKTTITTKTSTKTTSTTKTTTKSTTSTAPSGTSTYLCGTQNGNAICAKGLCCSQYGYCGNTTAYCGTGCQSGFGDACAAPSKTTTSTAPVGTSTTTCGPQNGNAICAAGYCCSQYGYCGQTDSYCAAGCQSGFGKCGGGSPASTSTSSSTSSSFIGSPTGSTLNCGPAYGNQVCLSGLCCSSAGWCNNDPDHCGAGCQSAFGKCGTSTAHPAGPTGSTTTCGPANNYAVCAPGLCCSISGTCGTGEDYCSDPFNCQFGYGDCDSSKTPSGTSTINDPRPLLGSVSYTQDISDCTAPNVIALTYDDGPLDYTGHLLDVLKQYGFHATFFISGNNIAKGEIDTTQPWPQYIQRMINEGHQVASHTWSHYDLGGLASSDRIQQMVKNERAIANIIGKYPTYMRPPFSSCSGDCQTDMQKLGYHRVYFDLDSQDYLNDNATLIQNSKNILKWALGNETQGENQLVLQHDIHYQTAYNLSTYYFDQIKAKGWKGVTVGECLQDPQQNWYRVPGTGKGTS